ncbi:hypothetical protein GQ55_1G411600 [Panicum hallii var. hallii]|uniref:Subtilisin-like protease n=1 Tax=Panicum hallii var. hallii TaxID=1504633 RepID=A0A2T7FCZ6_9POAL|nr:hypothetical protein GQ55_1G411600 [Panicum hallii var. hallii]
MARLAVAACFLLAVAAMSSYIVHVAAAHAPRSSLSRPRAYGSFLRDQLPTQLQDPAPVVHYSYRHAATGFAARLTGRQAAHLETQPSVLAIVPDVMLQLHTTMTTSFLRLLASSGLIPAADGATDVVIGVIDTGIYPQNRASFAAATKHLPRQLRLHTVSKSPLDNIGHGTHTASTAAGSAATDAAFYKYGKGTAVGVAPGARIASYKACWQTGCASSDVLAAFDEAIADGVDVISISVGDNRKPQKFHKDSVAVGALRAIRKGIVVSASAGNTGPAESTVTNVAPWLLTTGASTINCRFPDTVVLGNGETFTGTSLYAGSPVRATEIPLVYGGNVGSRFCEAGKLNSTMVAAKIVLCDYGINGGVAKGEAVKLAGGAGAILAGVKDFGEFAYANPHMFPRTAITFASTEKIMKYLSTDASPVTTVLFHGTVVGRIPTSPRIPSFSSRGPNRRAPEILKPDVIAPGVNILAAWTGESSPTGLGTDRRRVQYNIISGTSMSCPHVSGVAALLRQARPDWSPAAIKSALMTTAYVLDNAGNVIKDMSTGKASTPFARGSGHVDRNRPLDLGLVYDADADDYVSFLCALGYTADQIAVFTDDDPETDCLTHTGSAGDFNYPAFSSVFNPNMDNVTQRRTMRNVGCNFRATYTANITSPAGVRVTVKPRKLRFDARQRRRDYEITFFTPQGAGNLTDKYTFGSIVWSDGERSVTSPIAVTWPWPAPQVVAM